MGVKQKARERFDAKMYAAAAITHGAIATAVGVVGVHGNPSATKAIVGLFAFSAGSKMNRAFESLYKARRES